MASVVKSARASMDSTTGMLAPQISGLIAGAAIPLMAACYIKAADGKAYPCDATAADEKAQLAGFCPRVANAGEPITLFGVGMVGKYSDALLTPGQILYLDVAANAGGLSTTPTVGDGVGVAQAISASAIRVTRNIGSAVANLALAAIASLEDAPALGLMSAQAVVGDQAGAPAAGHILLKTWKATAANDGTPIATTVFGKKVSWIAIGT
jgi:hypothetical protein